MEPGITYQDVSCPAFLDALERVFKRFKEEGDHFLEVQSGHCCSLTCNPDQIRTAYRFVGNVSRDYLDLRFIVELTEDLNDHRILDIYQCHSLKCQEPSDWYGIQYLLTFYFDEEFPDQVSVEEKIHTQIALEAMENLETLPFVDLEKAQAWILSHSSTFEFLNNTPRSRGQLFTRYRWEQFRDFYQDLKDYLALYLGLNDSGALQEVFFWELLPDQELFKKIHAVEDILVEQGVYYIFNNNWEDKFTLPGGDRINLGGEKFDLLESFWKKFSEIQDPLLQRYYVFTEEEEEEYCRGRYDAKEILKLRLLSFHLAYRENSLKAGKVIPEWRGGK